MSDRTPCATPLSAVVTWMLVSRLPMAFISETAEMDVTVKDRLTDLTSATLDAGWIDSNFDTNLELVNAVVEEISKTSSLALIAAPTVVVVEAMSLVRDTSLMMLTVDVEPTRRVLTSDRARLTADEQAIRNARLTTLAMATLEDEVTSSRLVIGMAPRTSAVTDATNSGLPMLLSADSVLTQAMVKMRAAERLDETKEVLAMARSLPTLLVMDTLDVEAIVNLRTIAITPRTTALVEVIDRDLFTNREEAREVVDAINRMAIRTF